MARFAVTRLSAAALLLVGSGARAQGLPPWVPAERLPLPEDARSVEILRGDEPLFREANGSGARRGAAERGARLPLLGVKPGPGCEHGYLLVGAQAWVCSDAVRVTSELATSHGADVPATPDGLPRDYYFVGKDGALGYRDLASAEDTAPESELQPGFAVSVLRVGHGPRGDPLALTTKGLWVPTRDLGRVVPTTFHGYGVVGGQLDRGFVVAESAPVLASPGGRRTTLAPRHRFDHVRILETGIAHGRAFVRVDRDAWLDARDVRVPTVSAPPAEARAGERFIDVDVTAETLVAYEGTRPVFATLVSTGIGTGKAETATPLGVHRVWVKLRSTDMTNLEEPEASHYYAMQEVPWVLFFQKGYGLHGAFWHRSFGHSRSHGCVNLTPLDARRLFEWAGPALPPGWTAVLPTDYDPGTLIRVR